MIVSKGTRLIEKREINWFAKGGESWVVTFSPAFQDLLQQK